MQDPASPTAPSPALPADPIAPARPALTATPEDVLRTCPNCGRQLAERKCKLFCPDPRCGYYLSCADYY